MRPSPIVIVSLVVSVLLAFIISPLNAVAGKIEGTVEFNTQKGHTGGIV